MVNPKAGDANPSSIGSTIERYFSEDKYAIYHSVPKEMESLGRIIYLFSSLKQLMDIRPYDFSVHVDGVHREFTAIQIIVANAGILGTPPFRLGKGIKPDDGQLDLIIMNGGGAASYIAAGTDMVFGMDGYSSSFEHITGREIIIDGEESI